MLEHNKEIKYVQSNNLSRQHLNPNVSFNKDIYSNAIVFADKI